MNNFAIFWSQFSNRRGNKPHIILVDLMHDHAEYRHRALVISRAIQSVIGGKLVGILGQPGVMAYSKNYNRNDIIKSASRFGLNDFIDVPNIALKEIDKIADFELEKITYLSFEKIYNKILGHYDQNGLNIGKYVLETHMRAELDPILNNRTQLKYWFNYIYKFQEWINNFFDDVKDTIFFVTGHRDYCPWGMICHKILSSNGYVFYFDCADRTPIYCLDKPVKSPRLLSSIRSVKIASFVEEFSDSITHETFNDTLRDKICDEWRGLMNGNFRNWTWRDPHQDVDININFHTNRRFILFLNTLTDAPLSDEMLFASYYHWLVEHLEHAVASSAYDLVIKRHPADSNYDSFGITSQLEENYKSYKNIQFLSANISNSAVMRQFNAGVTVRGTRGLEMLSHGFPMIFAGASEAGDLGLGITPKSKTQYFSLFDANETAQHPSPYQIDLARALLVYINIWNAKETKLIPPFGKPNSAELAQKIEMNIDKHIDDLEALGGMITRNSKRKTPRRPGAFIRRLLFARPTA